MPRSPADHFRTAWEAGHRPDIERYLQGMQEPGLSALLGELLRVELHQRGTRGEKPTLGEYQARFPRHGRVVEVIFRSWQAEHVNDPGGPEAVEAAGEQLPRLPTRLPATFGRYQLLRLLGRGGMGSVYQAHDTQLDRLVALKIPHLEAGSEIRERFQREARAAASLDHPNICPIFDVGEVNGLPYLTMAYIEGEPLSGVLRSSGRLPIHRSVRLVIQLALALDEAHQRGVIHRDLKPSNVLLNHRGQPILTDFGLARRLAVDRKITRTGHPLGTPAYMSPEQVLGETSTIDVSTDIYSLGVILFELLTGTLPFEGPIASLYGQILYADRPRPSRFCPDVAPDLEAVVLRAMARERRERYPSMQSLASDLHLSLQQPSSPVAPLPPSPASPPVRKEAPGTTPSRTPGEKPPEDVPRRMPSQEREGEHFNTESPGELTGVWRVGRGFLALVLILAVVICLLLALLSSLG